MNNYIIKSTGLNEENGVRGLTLKYITRYTKERQEVDKNDNIVLHILNV